MKKISIFKSIICIIVTIFLLPNMNAIAAEPSRILILPLNMNSQEDLSFLQKGIGDMLSTRLHIEKKVTIIDPKVLDQYRNYLTGTINKDKALSLGSKLKADYVLFGSLTVFGDSISTDVNFVDVATGESRVVFHQAGTTHGDVIQHINIFANQVGEQVFDHRQFGDKPQPAPETETAAIDTSRQHPDKVWEDGGQDSADQSGTGIQPFSTDSPFQTGSDSSQSIFPGNVPVLGSSWNSRSYSYQIKGVGIGDIDGDGKNETVFIGDETISIFRYQNKRFVKLREIKEKSSDSFISVDIIDVNGDGKAEIYITNLPRMQQSLKSLVIGWNGNSFQKMAEEVPYYFRVVTINDRKILAGQKRRGEKLFEPGIFEMEYSGATLVPGDRLDVPNKYNVFNFTYGDVIGSGRDQIISLHETEKIYIRSESGEKIWVSPDKYGGSTIYMEYRDKTDYKETFIRVYLPQRLNVMDLDNDGRGELITVKNHDSGGRLFQKVRIFNKSEIDCLTWSDLGLIMKWKTQEFPGCILDYTIGDFNNDGKDELVFALTTKSGIVFKDIKSFLVACKLPKKK